MSDPLQPLYLVLDQGGSQSRALVLDAAGQIVARAHRPVATRRPAPQRVEQDPDEVVESLRDAAEAVVASLTPAQRQTLSACGLACQRSSLLAWDSHHRRPLTPLLSWQDSRGSACMPATGDTIERVRRLSGLYPSAHHGASKMAWLLRYNPEVNAAQQAGRLRWLPLASLLAQQLFGHCALDPANAQRTLLWSRHDEDWSDALLQLFGIEREALPPLQPSLGAWGVLSLADGLRLPARALAGDQSVAPLADGATVPGRVTINLGTGGFLCAPLPPNRAASRLLSSLAYTDATAAQYWLEGTVNGAGAALQWLAEQPPSQRNQSGRPGLFLNAVGGLGSPFWRADLSSRWLGPRDQNHHAAVVESMLFLIQVNLEAMRAAGVVIESLQLSGGLSRLAGLAPQLAQLSALPIRLSSESEATARGLTWLLAGRPARWQQAPATLIEPTTNRPLHHRYRRWQRALDCWLRNDHR